MGLIDQIRRFFRSVPRSVVFDEEKVVRTMSDGETEMVRWDELISVTVITTDEGPWSEDVFWILKSQDGGCAVPQGVTGAGELLKRLQELPGFKNEVFIEAMGSTRVASFLCWERDASV